MTCETIVMNTLAVLGIVVGAAAFATLVALAAVGFIAIREQR